VNNRKNRNVINSTLYLEKNQYNQNDTSYENSAIINLQILNRELQKILDNQKNNTRYQIREYNKTY
jgi:hypothetical protein